METGLTIGSLPVSGRAFLAPMAGVTDLAFRQICREWGAAMTTTEMVSAKALLYQDTKTQRILNLEENEHPSAVQLFGSDPEILASAAEKVLDLTHPDLIDLNMGCPMPKIVKNGEGCALMQKPDLASKIVQTIALRISVPVTVKIRLGWDRGSINAPEFARRMEASGASAVCVHGRTKTQLYSGTADWQEIAKVRKVLSIPLIANGDVFSGRDALRILSQTGAEALAVGRGSFGNPFLFQEINQTLGGLSPSRVPFSKRIETALRQFHLAVKDKGERVAMLEARKQYCWYLKGIPYAGYYKEKISHLSTLEELNEITKGVLRDLYDPEDSKEAEL